MKSLGVFFLVGVLTLWVAPPPRSGTILPMQKIPRVKPGICPLVPIRCKMLNPPNHCLSDSQCPGPEKCCDTGCGLGCVLTQQGKPDTCPYIIVKCAMENPPNRCYSDRQCPRFKKCCETFCGRNCVYPKGHGKA
ncbi:antileukoproteinase isoform X6 [Chelonia mydas]|uniref:antileukoproteinase isoform X6 n=1 Tax=Chelonia mydas TaxID=8469 RepID=UPI0018A1CA5E|nr:antileukoproteinase isoform X6 [Chelonia mydas]